MVAMHAIVLSIDQVFRRQRLAGGLGCSTQLGKRGSWLASATAQNRAGLFEALRSQQGERSYSIIDLKKACAG
jgi:hypothetical protein